jgi:hypothetical protein
MTTKAYVIATALVALMTVGSVPLLGIAAAQPGDGHGSDKDVNVNGAGNGGNGGHAGDGGNGGDVRGCFKCIAGDGGNGGSANGGNGGKDSNQKTVDVHGPL